MKIYTITLFMFALTLSLAAINGMGVFSSGFAVVGISQEEISNLLPDSVNYSDADVGLFIFGDFLKGLKIFARLFAYTPAILAFTLSELGAPTIISTIAMVMMYIPYLAGVLQILMKFSISGTE